MLMYGPHKDRFRTIGIELFCHQIDKLKRAVPRRQLFSRPRYIYRDLLIKNLSEDKFFCFDLRNI